LKTGPLHFALSVWLVPPPAGNTNVIQLPVSLPITKAQSEEKCTKDMRNCGGAFRDERRSKKASSGLAR
jgi:hypothetical protein